MGASYSFSTIATTYALIAMVLLLLPIKLIDHINRLLFMGLLSVVFLLIAGLAMKIDWSDLPLFSAHYGDKKAWMALIPVVFSAFGFQVIFHTLANYCRMNVKMLRQAFFWGSLIPAIIYIAWTLAILSVVYHENPQFYTEMVNGKAEVGELIQALGTIAKRQSVQLLIWCITLLAIATSVLGVGIGLYDSIKQMISKKVCNNSMNSFLASILTLLPAYLVVICVPNAFLIVLGFAGMILAIIAVLLPVYLFWQIKTENYYYQELNRKFLIQLSIAASLAIIVCEVCNTIK
jgi:tyrosine-specific transport protein